MRKGGEKEKRNAADVSSSVTDKREGDSHASAAKSNGTSNSKVSSPPERPEFTRCDPTGNLASIPHK